MSKEKRILFSAMIELENHDVLKNSKIIRFNRKTGARFIASNESVTRAKERMIFLLKSYSNKTQNNYAIDIPVNLKLIFYYPDHKFYTKKGARNKNLPDISNLYQLPEDALEAAGIIQNDRLIESHNGSKRLSISQADTLLDPNFHHLYIEITPA